VRSLYVPFQKMSSGVSWRGVLPPALPCNIQDAFVQRRVRDAVGSGDNWCDGLCKFAGEFTKAGQGLG
jgi:hypothetical protein